MKLPLGLRMLPVRRSVGWLIAISAMVGTSRAQLGQFDKTPVNPADEALVFTPAGFSRPGIPIEASGDQVARLKLSFVDRATGKPTACRVNVVGPDGNFHQPKSHPLGAYSLTGQWPDRGAGNRQGKAPIRYFGRFFYTEGKCEIEVPAGTVRIEAEKGFEYRPRSVSIEARAGQRESPTIELERAMDAASLRYFSGDPHLHFLRGTDAEDDTIFDLLEAEDVRFGVVMCYNETDRYSGSMSQLVMPQMRGLGRRSVRGRGGVEIVSGQEYRNAVYGHINLFWRDDLVLAGQSLDPNRWPVFGVVGFETRRQGGYAIHAHGGYAQEIYADLVQHATQGVELLQFGIYRGIGLEGWYRVLNCGYRFPAVGASDYPACRKLSDCRSYVWCEGEPSIKDWLDGLAAGRSFVTTGPLLLLTVDGRRPGEQIDLKEPGPRQVVAKVRARSEVCPVSRVQLVVNGKVERELAPGEKRDRQGWIELEVPVTVDRSCWIAARAFSQAATGSPDGESHTNPVYVYVNGKAAYEPAALDWLAEQIDAQITEQEKRDFAERSRVVDYFRRSRALLDEIRERGGQAAPAPADEAPNER